MPSNSSLILKKNKSSKPTSVTGCSFATIVWFLLLVIVIAIVTSWIISQYYLPKWQIKGINLAGINLNLPNFSATSSTADSYAVHILDNDFNEILRQISVPNVENLATSIKAEQIEIRGNTTTAIKAGVFISFKPVVSQGSEVTLEVHEVTIGGIRMMPLMTDAIRSQICQSITSYTHNRFSGKITKIELKEGEMTVWVTPDKIL